MPTILPPSDTVPTGSIAPTNERPATSVATQAEPRRIDGGLVDGARVDGAHSIAGVTKDAVLATRDSLPDRKPSDAKDGRLPSEPAETIRRNKILSIADGATYAVMVGLGETYIAAFALALGHQEIFSGLVTTVPVLIGSVLQLVTPWGVLAVRSNKRWVLLCAIVQTLCFLPLVGAAMIGTMSAQLFLLVASIYWGSSLATNPAWNTWIGTLVPDKQRARFFAIRSRLNQYATLTGFVVGGITLQYGRAQKFELAVFAGLFTTGFLCRGISTICLAFHTEPEPLPKKLRILTLREQFHRLTAGKGGKLLTYMVGMQMAAFIAGPFFNPYMFKVLNLSYLGYATLIGTSFLAKAIFLPAWGRFSERYGTQRLLWAGAIGIIPLSAGWIVSSNFYWLLANQIAAGAFWGAYELACLLLFFETIPSEERTSVLTLYNLANSLALVVGSMIGAAILQVGEVSPSAYLTIFGVSSVARLLMIGLLWRLPRMEMRRRQIPVEPSLVSCDAAPAVAAPVIAGLELSISKEMSPQVTKVVDNPRDDSGSPSSPQAA